MRKYVLGRGITNKISKVVDGVYDNLKTKFFGPKPNRPIFTEYRHHFSIFSLFEEAAKAEYLRAVDSSIVDRVVRIADKFIDSQKERVKAHILKIVESAIVDGKNITEEIQSQLSPIWDKAKRDLETVVTSESTAVKNLGLLEGIVRTNAFLGIKDPVVFFKCTFHGTCKECLRLHCMEDEYTPRCWYMSELGSGYHKKGDKNPKITGLHPNENCSLHTLLPGYGLKGNEIVWVKQGHSEINKQRKQ